MSWKSLWVLCVAALLGLFVVCSANASECKGGHCPNFHPVVKAQAAVAKLAERVEHAVTVKPVCEAVPSEKVGDCCSKKCERRHRHRLFCRLRCR